MEDIKTKDEEVISDLDVAILLRAYFDEIGIDFNSIRNFIQSQMGLLKLDIKYQITANDKMINIYDKKSLQEHYLFIKELVEKELEYKKGIITYQCDQAMRKFGSSLIVNKKVDLMYLQALLENIFYAYMLENMEGIDLMNSMTGESLRRIHK